MSNYKRLTKRICGAVLIEDEFGNDISTFYKPLGDIIDRLAELEDKIEQGTLIELPCKVGDTVWKLDLFPKEEIIGIEARSLLQIFRWVADESFGVFLFRTKAEAEKFLKELHE